MGAAAVGGRSRFSVDQPNNRREQMRHLKILGLLAVVAAVFMVFTASASATTVTGPAGETNPIIHLVSEESAVAGTKHVVLHNPIATIECESTTRVVLTSLTFSPCTNQWVVDGNKPGFLEIHGEAGNKGTVTSLGTKITATRFGLECVYETGANAIGTITGGNPATLKLNGSIPINTTLSSFLCGSTPASWTGAYKTTGTIDIDQ